MASPSQQFIAAIEPQRDALYAQALAGSATPAAAETALIAAVRKAWAGAIAKTEGDPVAATAASLASAASIAPAAMPADVWARITAAIQVEAAKSAGGSGLAEGHILLKPDPLLAPKKIKRTAYRAGIAPAYRFIAAALVVVAIGVGLTIFIIRQKNAPIEPSAPTHAP